MAWLDSRNTSLPSLGFCLLLLPLYPAPLPPTTPTPALCSGLVHSQGHPSACPHFLHSYSRGQQCLEQADWETAVLFFSRALHLDPQLVRGRPGWAQAVAGTCFLPPCCTCQIPPLRATKSLMGIGCQRSAGAETFPYPPGADSGEDPAAWVPSPLGGLLRLAGRGLPPAL